ncbi:Spermidine/putrescine ABC transporter ATPase subunit (plasmid) [Neorhizobium galegae bv. officinalis bv. officinalis str. HAMBI 1141]|uniref:Spermidine/putrescine ABC transporter ATPase subunit n=1 Tax=Neorhizobium galegae bv. officinalis bv. officinalis str. HAMBI 1141 TaxID=1028801 RepID=A0A068TG89_NEOGA|nr:MULTISPECIES: ABC transporter ATP-binding protein [Neorhizobium]MCJ9669621.1 ABC transporter ATP-binding protein [Neorhizobium sp. SHOUNA12B]MCJ9745998.1 ABC transporter ATP-binding protein [Neorhizobium sp. SHOUNA12A]CDN57462.1 Spermidine/putrescine ABC transporter ATPase subunit [Neorhizobium galegae bv. officinalis bv. officinalis str. HAMBI 1141]
MADHHVVIDNLVKTYPGAQKPSVDHVSFSLPRGEMLALLGPSGCGKTTILRMIAGLIAPTSGAIRLEGKDVSSIAVYKRNMGMVFQAYALFPHMTVAQNISFGLEMRKVGRAEREERVRKALDLVKLTGLGDRKVSQLSGGQQQRAAIARSLVIEPELLLLDEPLSNLDAKLRDEMRDEIRDIQARTGVTAIFVTHDQDEALSMADRLAVMSAGRLEQVGTPREIFDRPQTEFVASFIGAGTFFEGQVAEPGLAVVEGLKSLRFVGEAPVGSTVKLMIRPHRLVLADSAGQPNSFTGTVEHIVYRGQILTLNIRCGGRLLQADLPTHAGVLPEKGDEVTLAVAAQDVTLVGQVAP